MKRGLALLLAALIGLTAAIVWLVLNGYPFAALLVGMGTLAVVASILHAARAGERRMERMIASIRHGDLNIAFPEGAKGRAGELNRSMNQALTSFRSRLHERVAAETESDAWQKLIRVLTHEMMNSLTPIISLSQTVLERAGSDRPDAKEYALMLEALRTIGRRSRGLLDFVENYRRLTRVPEPVKQVFAAEELFRAMRGIFSERGEEISFTVNPPAMRLYADRALIEQELLNLLNPALEASGEERARVRVEAFEEAGRSVIRVSDSGSGIVPEAMERIFIPFYTTRPGGSGIGLALARQIASRHGGTLTAESRVEEGSVFTMMW
jgi:signal transduction histidine kinase